MGDWGKGRVELVQLPTPDETHDNIVAYWVPAQLPAAGQPLELSYELAWQGDAQQRPPASWVTQTRRGYGFSKLSAAEQASQPQYVIDFAGDEAVELAIELVAELSGAGISARRTSVAQVGPAEGLVFQARRGAAAARKARMRAASKQG